VLEGGSCGRLGLEDVGQLSGWFSGSPGDTLGAPGDDGHSPGICARGNILDPSYFPWWRSYPCHCGP